MRGKYRLVKIEPGKKFTCAIGKSKDSFHSMDIRSNSFLLGRDLKFQGPFRCLNHKVDLTHNEAENTLFQMQEQLEKSVVGNDSSSGRTLLSLSDCGKKPVFGISPEY